MGGSRRPIQKSADSCLCSSLTQRYLPAIRSLTTQGGDELRPIRNLAAGGTDAYTIDHRPIWLQGRAPLTVEESKACGDFPRKASRLPLHRIGCGAYPSQQVQRALH